MRPSTVGSACVRNATDPGCRPTPAGSVHARARVAVRVDGQAAPAAVGAAGGDDAIGVVAERGGLAARDVEPDVAVVASSISPSSSTGDDLLELDHEPVGAAVVARARSGRARRPARPARRVRARPGSGGHPAGGRSCSSRSQVLGDGGHLLLLALHASHGAGPGGPGGRTCADPGSPTAPVVKRRPPRTRSRRRSSTDSS